MHLDLSNLNLDFLSGLDFDPVSLLFGQASTTLANLSRYILPLIGLWIVARCVRSMLRERYEP